MARRSSSSSTCAICEGSNFAAVCAACVNHRLGEHSATLKSLKIGRDALYVKLNGVLVAKKKANEQYNWKILQKEKLMKRKDKLYDLEKKLSQEKAKVKRVSNDLKAKYGLLEPAFAMLEKNRAEMLENSYPNVILTQNLGYVDINVDCLHKQSMVIKQICRLFPMRKVNSDGDRKDGCNNSYVQICNARLPRGLDPHSVPSEELAASLGYMLQLLNLVIPNLAAPALHNAGFAGSCSRIWQRDSYWDARPSSQSKEYPLFIPRQNFCSSGGENSWSERSSSNFGVASVDSERKPYLDPGGSSSFNYSSASPHSVETHMDLQKGISLLKKSVACITAHGYNSIGLDVPSEASTFEAFAELLATLSSSNLKPAYSRSGKEAQQLNKSVWHANSMVSSSIAESTHTAHVAPNSHYNNLSNTAVSFLSTAEITAPGRSESLVDGWDIVERLTLPPPPSHLEDVEHWTRAMFTDATKK